MTEEDIFDGALGSEDDAAPVQAEPEVQAPETPPQEPPAPAEPQEPAPQQAPVQDPAQLEPPQERHPVPLSELLNERDKRKAEKERADRLEAELAQFRRQQEAPQQDLAPDPVNDPEGFQAFVNDQIQAAQQNAQWLARTEVSQQMANQAHGSEKVQEAVNAFMQEATQKPWLMAEMRSQSHPYEYVVKRHQQQEVLSKVTPDHLAQFQTWLASQGQAPAQSPTPPLATATPATPPPTPPRSLASATSAGGLGVVGEEDPFDAEFSRKR